MPAERRLRDIEPLGGTADVALFGDGDEVADLTQAHGSGSTYARVLAILMYAETVLDASDARAST